MHIQTSPQPTIHPSCLLQIASRHLWTTILPSSMHSRTQLCSQTWGSRASTSQTRVSSRIYHPVLALTFLHEFHHSNTSFLNIRQPTTLDWLRHPQYRASSIWGKGRCSSQTKRASQHFSTTGAWICQVGRQMLCHHQRSTFNLPRLPGKQASSRSRKDLAMP